jgi:hypothetical protein
MPILTPVLSPAINDITADGKALSITIEATGPSNVGEADFLAAVRTRLVEPALDRSLIKLIGLKVWASDGVPLVRNAQANPTWTDQLVSQTPVERIAPYGATEFEFPYFTLPALTDSIKIEVTVRRSGQ